MILNPTVIPKADVRRLREGKITFRVTVNFFIISLLIIPSYFGIRLAFFDLTALRMSEILLLYAVLSNKTRNAQFIKLVKSCKYTKWIGIFYGMVCITNLIHPSINAVFYWLTNGILIFYIVCYILKYVYTLDQFLTIIYKCVLFVCVVSLLEVVIGKSPFLFLNTLGKNVGMDFRFGSIRIKGPCWESNAYGLYLMMFLPMVCYDVKTKKINMFARPILLVLMIVNIFLTGARLSMGQLVLALLIIIFSQERKYIVYTFKIMTFIILALVFFLVLCKDSYAQGILRTVFSAVDAVLGTHYSLAYGASETVLNDSSYYRELLLKNTIVAGWPDLLIGRGESFRLHLYVEGYEIISVDNYYVGMFVSYAWPGLISWLVMCGSFLLDALFGKGRKKAIIRLFAISFICYFIGLWYLDQLQTFQLMMLLFGIEYSSNFVRDMR